MKKNLILLFMMLFSVVMAKAETNDAIYVWVDGTSTCYKLEAMPQVTYDEGSAVLTVSGETVLTLELKDGAELIVTYGQYQEATGIDNANAAEVKREGKFITGGRLVIIRDGKQYDAQGRIIK